MSGHILLVDDDRAFRLSTAALLESEGHRVTGAATGAEAVRALEDGRFELVLMDLRMPGVDGIDVVEVLRTRGETTPVLMVSGYGTVDAAVRALHSGVDDFLTKPVEPEVLLDRVQALLRRRPCAARCARWRAPAPPSCSRARPARARSSPPARSIDSRSAGTDPSCP
jgi:DNA-binding response OmpR family regulator